MTSPADTTTEPVRPEARAPRGFQDRRGHDLVAERRIVQAVSEVYERWGFEPLETSAFEYADALGKFLPDADRPNEGVFALQDDDDQWMALRYDLTAPLARFAAQTWETLPKPFRRYAFGPVWRNEKPGPGRFREFVQCDADTVGSDRPEADAEIIAMAVEGLQAAGLAPGQAVIKIASRKLVNGVLQAAGVTEQGQTLAVLRAVDKLDRLGPDGVKLLLGEGRLDDSGDFTRGAGLNTKGVDAVLAFLAVQAGSRDSVLNALDAVVGGTEAGAEGLNELGRISAALKAMGVADEAAGIDPSVVRGLEYYTGAVFEAELLLDTTDDKGRPVRFGSIGGGGRYDDLVARFTGERTPATGFSFGVSRLVSALRAAGQDPAGDARGPVVIIAFSEDDMAHYFAAASELRGAGIAAEVYLGKAGMKAQMKYADRRGAPAAVIMGGDEIAAGKVTIKDLDLGRELARKVADNDAWRSERPGQSLVDRADLTATVRAILDHGK
ncbi:histidine--tRNA ligase [Brevundimonas sp. BAL450]|jgi:histidyl-tRNA synthetase|uniref:Histidine--tRNA ligase n=1 Tax=Brevundimonas abyssalis TAR-001 TaxID=1391729 RepID=A0A8E0NDK4_9CAUL|nr:MULTISPECIES: histidine--tRNA ligase [Brevundimonas]MBG7614135.1 histidine--tRNA ligase [Brevundimonas sp. BAL450]GAD60336.1 histidyl-tRNA synthetase [Brevundimonas abyssalis TAR-001]